MDNVLTFKTKTTREENIAKIQKLFDWLMELPPENQTTFFNGPYSVNEGWVHYFTKLIKMSYAGIMLMFETEGLEDVPDDYIAEEAKRSDDFMKWLEKDKYNGECFSLISIQEAPNGVEVTEAMFQYLDGLIYFRDLRVDAQSLFQIGAEGYMQVTDESIVDIYMGISMN